MKLVAETAWHHEGDFQYMEKLVSEICSKTRADVVKLHITLDLDEYMSRDHPAYDSLSHWLFKEHQWLELIKIVRESEKELMLLLNDTKAVEFGMQLKPKYVEIHSVCMNDLNLLASLKRQLSKEIKVFFGVGGSSLYEIESAINTLEHSNNVLMFGFQNYPTQYADVNFNKMRRIMNLFQGGEYGYADHTAWNETNNQLITLLGAAIGMQYVEKHVTISFGEQRTDWSSAVSLDMLNDLKEGMDVLDKCNGDGLLQLNTAEKKYSVFGPMKKAGVLKQEVKAGQVLDADMVSFKRTGRVTDISQLQLIEAFGKKTCRAIPKNQVLMSSHFKEDKE